MTGLRVNAVEPPQWLPPWGGQEEQWLAWANALPMVGDLGMVCTRLSVNSARCVVATVPLSPNPNGAVNGGIVVAITDQLMAMVAIRAGREGQLPATGSLHTQFHRPALTPLTVDAQLLGGGERVSFVEAVVYDLGGRRCATSQATMVAGGSLRRI